MAQRSTETRVATHWLWYRLTPVIALVCGLASCGADKTQEKYCEIPPLGATLSKVTENLITVVETEHCSRPNTVLVNASGFVGLDGKLLSGNGWSYDFADFKNFLEYEWRVDSDGYIDLTGYGPPTNQRDTRDILSLLKIDSDQAVKIAIENGAADYISKHKNIYIIIGYNIQGNILVCDMLFRDAPGTGNGCSIEFWVDATTGAVLARDLSCL